MSSNLAGIDNNMLEICQSWVNKVDEVDSGKVKTKLEDKAKLISERCIPSNSRKHAHARATKKSDDSTVQRPRRDRNSVRISNLPESVERQDLQQLVKPFGLTKKLFLAEDKTTNLCKGFAYAHFKNKEDGERAIQELNGYHYGNLILSAEWAEERT